MPVAQQAAGQTPALVPLLKRMDPDERQSLSELARALQAKGVPTVSRKGRVGWRLLLRSSGTISRHVCLQREISERN